MNGWKRGTAIGLSLTRLGSLTCVLYVTGGQWGSERQIDSWVTSLIGPLLRREEDFIGQRFRDFNKVDSDDEADNCKTIELLY